MFIDAGFIREMQRETADDIASLIVTTPDMASRKVLADNGAVRICLYALDAHTAGHVEPGQGSVCVRVVEGSGRVNVDGHAYELETGASLLFDGQLGYGLQANDVSFKVLSVRLYDDCGAIAQEEMNDE